MSMWCKQQHENKHTQHEEGNNINNNTAKCNGNLIDREFNVQKPKQTETYRSISHHIARPAEPIPEPTYARAAMQLSFLI